MEYIKMKQPIPPASGSNTIRKTCAFLVIGLLAAHVQADEAALYGPSAPKGSAFVRLYNAGNQEVSASVGNTQLSDVGPLGSSDFSFLPGGAPTPPTPPPHTPPPTNH